MKRTALAACAIVLAAGLGGCSGDSEQTLVASARAYVDKNDFKSAIIQLKSALQKNPKSGPARELLGRALLESGDPASALVELRKAQELNVREADLLPDMARSMLLLHEAAQVTAQFDSTDLHEAQANADLATTVASAWAQQGDKAKALEATNRALRAQPGHAPAIVLQAQLKLADHDIDGALFLLDEVLRKDPGNPRAGTLKGEILWQGRHDRDAAAASLRQVLQTNPRSVAARASLVRLLAEQGKDGEADTELAELVKSSPNHPDTLYLQARSAYRKQDWRGAQEIVDKVLKALPENVPALELSGAAALRLKNYAQAETRLAHALKLSPGLPLARNLLAQCYLRTGQTGRAAEVLQSVLADEHADGPSLAVAGESFLEIGDAKRADEAFRRAALTAPQDPQVRTTVAIARIARGEGGTALTELEALAADTKSPRADMALISARLARKDIQGALKAVDALQQKLPANALPSFLRGRVLLLTGDRDGATRAFEAALSKEASYFPAVASLASLDMSAGHADLARKRFEALLKVEPSNYRAHLSLAEIANQTGAPAAEIQRHLDDAVKAAPDQPEPRVMRVNQFLHASDSKAALEAAQDAVAALPNQVDVLDALGRAQLAARDGQRAVSTFSKLVALQPANPLYLVRLADAYVANADNTSARSNLRRALAIDPGLAAAWRSLAALALTEKHPDEALAVAREMQAKAPKDGAGFALEGEIEATRQNWPGAIAALRAALQRTRSTDHAIALHAALGSGKQAAEGTRMATDWQREHPRDAAFRYYLGDESLKQGDWPVAEAHYREVLALQPRNVLALNNVAWLMVKQGKPGAVALAEQANTLAPGRAPLLDTLASALAADNQLPRALEVQKQALQQNPQDPGLRLNLARLYAKTGDKTQARTELQALAKLGNNFRGQPEVAELLKSLQ